MSSDDNVEPSLKDTIGGSVIRNEIWSFILYKHLFSSKFMLFLWFAVLGNVFRLWNNHEFNVYEISFYARGDSEKIMK